ncbi:hypothetical protein [Paenibacillus sp. CF384]|uniref:hypothetical protein n=1 Tax=Paenibacillus sp. CF384 TaxID=1884382 RepID=UPI00089488D8|nr:hypothetical protein [Paenibacillus sp. CF384]SDW03310.1 hypothetical protein SAMN05518855_100124 [Paenibacillus sp. CF384]
MLWTTLQYDVDFDNAMLFGQYVMVVTDKKASGGGLLEGYDEHHVRINGKSYSRTQATFIQMPPPEMQMDFAAES